MSKRAFVGIIVLLLMAQLATAQQETVINTGRGIAIGDTVKLKPPRKYYDPKIASRRSALLPGLGQIYNDSWWKVPILYIGLGVTAYYIQFNNHKWKTNRDLVRNLVEMQNNGVAINTNELRSARRLADFWRQNRDLLYLTTVGIYALNIIEAAIDAHLKGFNVDENLGLNFKPKLGVINNGAPYMGIGITLPIGNK